MVKNIDSATFKNKMSQDDTFIIDVRTQKEFESGYISEAHNHDIMNGEFQNNFREWDPNKNYLIYCRSGQRSAKACEILEQKGFTNVYNLEGGILGWDGPTQK